MKSVVLIITMSLVTILLRTLPFLVFRNHTPKYISYLGKVLPPAIIGMLVIYCLKDVTVFSVRDPGTDRGRLHGGRSGVEAQFAYQHPLGYRSLYGTGSAGVLIECSRKESKRI